MKVYSALWLCCRAALALLPVLGATLPLGAQEVGPRIENLKVTPSELVRPSRGSIYFAHFTFDYSDGGSRITKLVITAIDPIQKSETSTTEAVGAVGIVGSKGNAQLTIPYASASLPGSYKYRLQLINAKGEKSADPFVSITVRESGERPLDITGFTPGSAAAGDTVTVEGSGFDVSRPNANAVRINGVSAVVKQATTNKIIFVVPPEATTGHLRVVDSLGIAESPKELVVEPRISISGAGKRVLNPYSSTKFTASISGLTDRSVEWGVDGVVGGSALLGTIDATGVYTAPPIPPGPKVEISAVAKALPTLAAKTQLQLAPPLPLVGAGVIRSTTGGSLRDEDGLFGLNIPAGALKDDLMVTALKVEFLQAEASLPSVEGVPLVRIEIGAKGDLTFSRPATFRLLLPMWTPPGTKYRLLFDADGKYVDSGIAYLTSLDGISISGILKRLSGTIIIIRRVGDEPQPTPPIRLLGPEVTGLKVPFTPIEEGMTVPVLIEGKRFWGGYTRVLAHAPTDPNEDQFLDVGPTVVSADGTQVGFTLRIKPMPMLLLGQQLPISFRVQRLYSNGDVQSQVDTDPSLFILNGLPELYVPDPKNQETNLFTIDGVHVDRVVNKNGRFSEVRVDQGATLGIGTAVTTVSSARADGNAWDLSTASLFEGAFGRLSWITDGQRASSPPLRIFQPVNHRVTLDVTGPINISGLVICDGMHGGENPAAHDPLGLGRPGGLASDVLSGGIGGDGGVSTNGSTQNGHRAGNNTDLGRGRGDGGRLVSTQQLGGFGSRFDPEIFSLDDWFSQAIALAAFASQPPGEVLDWALLGLSQVPVVSKVVAPTQVGALPLIVAGQGGDGGTLRAAPDMPDDNAIIAGDGGSGGGGGGSSYYATTLFGIALSADKRIGVGGGGGGGAAGALRITSSSWIQVNDLGSIIAKGGRGGIGEPHFALASQGGGGGGGSGGMLKIQAPQVSIRGMIDLSGGDRGGAILVGGRAPAPEDSAERVCVLDGPLAGAFLFYGFRNIGVYPPTVKLAWPNGRFRAQIFLPFAVSSNGLGGIRAIGTGFSPFDVLSATINHTSPKAGRYILIITAAGKLVLASAPDPTSGDPQISPFLGTSGEILDLHDVPQLAGILPTAVAQSPVPPYHIFIAGVAGPSDSNEVDSQIHELDSGANYVRMVFHATTLNLFGGSAFIGHLKEISFLSDGTLVGMMTILAPGSIQNGIHIIDPESGTARLIFPETGPSMASMSVLRVPAGPSRECPSFFVGRQQRDLFYVVRWDPVLHEDGGHVPTQIEWYETNGRRTSLAAFANETISSPGEPGLLRVDGPLPGSNAACILFDGQPLADLLYGGQPTTYSAPAIGSFSAPVISASTGNDSLVFGGSGILPVYAQGAEPGDNTIQLWLASGSSPGQVVSVLTADDTGAIVAQVKLSPGFNTIWLQTSRGGETSDLLKRHVLYIPEVWPPATPAG